MPAAAETVPGLTAIGWQAISVRAGTPQALVTKLGEDLRTTMTRPDARARLDRIGTPFTPIFGADVARFIEGEQKLWWPIVKEAAAR